MIISSLYCRRKAIIKRLNNAFWLCHKAYNSKAKVVYGTVYEIPEEIGMVDISTFGSILLHVRDPFLALQNALSALVHKFGDVLITEPMHNKPTFQFLD